VVVGEWVDVEQTPKEIRFHKPPDELGAIRGACGVADHATRGWRHEHVLVITRDGSEGSHPFRADPLAPRARYADMAVQQADLCTRFSALYTGAVIDVLDELGLRAQALPHEIIALNAGMKLAGPAFTIEGRPHPDIDYEASMVGILEMLEAVPSGHVCAYQTHDSSCSHLGELSVTALKARGCRGAVIDGGCRDVEYILREDIPVFCRYSTPTDAVGRWEVLRYGHEIFIGGVRVATGDFVVADRDGVVVVPQAVSEQVLERAEAIVGTENLVREAVRKGMGPLEAFRLHGRF